MKSVKVNVRSRYAQNCRLVRHTDGNMYFSLRKMIEAQKRTNDIFHTVVSGDRYDSIAWRYWMDPNLWWIVADYAIRDGHRILFDFEDLEPGMVLRLPSMAYVQANIINKGKRHWV